MEFEKIVEEFKRIEEVTAIVLGGSRAKNTNDEKSDYDVYIYYDSPVSKEKREEILKKQEAEREANRNNRRRF